jgi:hypothetical protein
MHSCPSPNLRLCEGISSTSPTFASPKVSLPSHLRRCDMPRQASRIVVEWPPPFGATTLAATSSRPFHGLPCAFSGHVYARPSRGQRATCFSKRPSAVEGPASKRVRSPSHAPGFGTRAILDARCQALCASGLRQSSESESKKVVCAVPLRLSASQHLGPAHSRHSHAGLHTFARQWQFVVPMRLPQKPNEGGKSPSPPAPPHPQAYSGTRIISD